MFSLILFHWSFCCLAETLLYYVAWAENVHHMSKTRLQFIITMPCLINVSVESRNITTSVTRLSITNTHTCICNHCVWLFFNGAQISFWSSLQLKRENYHVFGWSLLTVCAKRKRGFCWYIKRQINVYASSCPLRF